MSKKTKMLQMINLLCHRNCVSLQTIKKVCDIPTRTVYRYLNSLSEANIPVYYDRKAGGYKLMRQKYATFDELSLNDAVLLVTCLRIVQQHVNSDYGLEIRELVDKIIVRKEFPIEDLGRPRLGSASKAPTEPDYSSSVTSALVEAAVLMSRNVELTPSPDSPDRASTEYENPSLVFKDGWHVGSHKPNSARPKPLSKVSKVKIS